MLLQLHTIHSMNAYIMFQVNNLLTILLPMFLLVLDDDDDTSAPSLTQNQLLLQLLLSLLLLLLLLLCFPHLLLMCLPKWKEKGQYSGRDQDIVQLLMQHLEKSHAVLTSFISLSPWLLCQPTTSQHGQRIATYLWFMNAYDLCT